MFINFSKTLYFSLVQNGFGLIQNMYDSPQLNELTKYIGLSKSAGSALYIVFLVNLDNMDLETYKTNAAEYAVRLENNASSMNIRNVYITNILISECHDNDIQEFAEIYEEFISQPIYTTNFYAVLSHAQVYSSIKDKDDFLNFREQILQSFTSKEFTVAEDFDELRRKELSLTVLAPIRGSSGIILLLVSINIVLWFLMELAGGSTQIHILETFGALAPEAIFHRQEYYRLFSSIFLHIGLLHLSFNCLSLYIFGGLVEKHLGVLKFLIIYLLSGLCGNILSLFFVEAISAGASSAIFGMAGVLLAITQKTKKTIDGFSKQVLITFIVMNLSFGLLAWNINNYAHIGGLIAGYLLGLSLYTSTKKIQDKSIRA